VTGFGSSKDGGSGAPGRPQPASSASAPATSAIFARRLFIVKRSAYQKELQIDDCRLQIESR
jgi:hypothetical protein